MTNLIKRIPEREGVRYPRCTTLWIGVRVDRGSGDSTYIVAAGTTQGYFNEIEIPEWVSTSDGNIYRFEGICAAVDVATYRDGLLTLPPGLFMR